ncbi:MAG: hypothetical protein RLZZ618_1607, partial [Pseudomonadota bacterium]
MTASPAALFADLFADDATAHPVVRPVVLVTG